MLSSENFTAGAGKGIRDPVLRWPRVKAIAAMSRNRVIGRAGGLPWHLPEEFAWFREATLGHVVLMGRRTWDGLPGGRPLPGRLNLVASRRALPRPPGGALVERVTDLADFRPEDYAAGGREVFVAGGAEIYQQLLPRCSELLLTLVDREVRDGDTFFPPFENDFVCAGTVRRGDGFQVRRYLPAARKAR